MSDEREDRYIQFPLCLLRRTYQNPAEGLNTILDFGIVHYSKSFKAFTLDEVARQLMYDYYRDKDFIFSALSKSIDRYIQAGELAVDEYYCGFVNGSFSPDTSIGDLLKIFGSDGNFKQMAITCHQLRLARENLKLSFGSVDTVLAGHETGTNYQMDFEGKFGKDAMPSIKVEMLFEALKLLKSIDLLRAYIAIKSLYGNSNFATSNKIAVLSRMLGLKSKESFDYYTSDSCKQDKNLLPTFGKYSHRYHMDNLLLTLAEKKYIMFLSKPKVSQIYFSRYMPPGELVELVKTAKEKKSLKEQIKNAAKSL